METKPSTNQSFPASSSSLLCHTYQRTRPRQIDLWSMQEERKALISSMDSSELRKVFQMFDKNGDGQITKKELGDSLRNLGIYIADDELDATMGKIDANGDGCVDVEEFGLLYRSIVDEGQGPEGDKHDEEEEMREAFNVFDQNGDGYITVDELRSVLASLGLKQGRTAEDCRKMISKVDADGDGRVDFTEFKQMMRGGGFAALGR
ncbi:hypothetical protein BS78_08G065500 [Paspalum vaginatum]|nr:hypothetical protein BS78_08G065500 [Paspalum vaginatum]